MLTSTTKFNGNLGTSIASRTSIIGTSTLSLESLLLSSKNRIGLICLELEGSNLLASLLISSVMSIVIFSTLGSNRILRCFCLSTTISSCRTTLYL